MSAPDDTPDPVGPTDPPPAARSPHADAQATARQALVDARADLASLRAERDGLNDRIRLLVEQVTTLASVVTCFDRRERAEREAETKGRRPRSEP